MVFTVCVSRSKSVCVYVGFDVAWIGELVCGLGKGKCWNRWF